MQSDRRGRENEKIDGRRGGRKDRKEVIGEERKETEREKERCKLSSIKPKNVAEVGDRNKRGHKNQLYPLLFSS